jgi:hypothetical protein
LFSTPPYTGKNDANINKINFLPIRANIVWELIDGPANPLHDGTPLVYCFARIDPLFLPDLVDALLKEVLH